MRAKLSQSVRHVLNKSRSSRSRRPSQYSRRDLDEGISDDSSRNEDDNRPPRRSIFSRRQSGVSDKSDSGSALRRWPSRRRRQKSTTDAEGRRRSTSRRPHWRRGPPGSSSSVAASPDVWSSSPDQRDLEHWPSGTPCRLEESNSLGLSYAKRQDTDRSLYPFEAPNATDSPDAHRPRSSRSGRRRDPPGTPPSGFRSSESTRPDSQAHQSARSSPRPSFSNDDLPALYDIPDTPRALSVRGTPTDLTQFYFPKPWVPRRFESKRKIANAIHGEVRCANDLLEKKQVVVKVIHAKAVKARDAGELENPLVEIGAMTYLFSKKAVYPVDLVAKLYGVYADPQCTYLVTEYCSGGELFREVVQRKHFPERMVKAIALQLALALHSLHKNGICHRDVSLENTLLAGDKTVRLIDFGQAECIHDHLGRERKMTGSAGKDYYRAPEMTAKGQEYEGPPVDVFALGVEIFIMAVGSPPWNEANVSDARYRSLTAHEESLNTTLQKWGKRDSLSDAFVDILTGIFCSKPHERPTIQDLLMHPWFAFDRQIWRWMFTRGHSSTIMRHIVEVDKYLKENRFGNFFVRKCEASPGDLYSFVTAVSPTRAVLPSISREDDRNEQQMVGLNSTTSASPPSSADARSAARKSATTTRIRRSYA